MAELYHYYLQKYENLVLHGRIVADTSGDGRIIAIKKPPQFLLTQLKDDAPVISSCTLEQPNFSTSSRFLKMSEEMSDKVADGWRKWRKGVTDGWRIRRPVAFSAQSRLR